MTGLKPAISNLGEAETLAIEVCRLAGIAHPEFNVMNALASLSGFSIYLLSRFNLRIGPPYSRDMESSSTHFYRYQFPAGLPHRPVIHGYGPIHPIAGN